MTEEEREYIRQLKAEAKRQSNSSIMPISGTRGEKEVGLFKYVEFDTNLNEIRMEIPLSKLMDMDENKKLREEID